MICHNCKATSAPGVSNLKRNLPDTTLVQLEQAKTDLKPTPGIEQHQPLHARAESELKRLKIKTQHDLTLAI